MIKKTEMTTFKILLAALAIFFGAAVADDGGGLPASKVVESNEKLTDKNAKKSRGSGGRVIEYGGEVDTNGGVVSAKVSGNAMQEKPTEPKKPLERNINQKNSVKLITGGDPSDGNAKSGHLPVLD